MSCENLARDKGRILPRRKTAHAADAGADACQRAIASRLAKLIQPVFAAIRAAACHSGGDDHLLPLRKPLERFAARQAERCDAAALFDIKRKFHVSRFHADDRDIEQAFVREWNAAVHLDPV